MLKFDMRWLLLLGVNQCFTIVTFARLPRDPDDLGEIQLNFAVGTGFGEAYGSIMNVELVRDRPVCRDTCHEGPT